MQKHYDIIIIGTGAGGGTLAYALAPTGKSILLLDKGEAIPKEKQNWNPKALYMEGRYRTCDTWLDGKGNTLHPNSYERVGGATKIYGGALIRMRKEDFQELPHYEGVSPSWCLSYDDFEPYYTAAEKLYKVHGNRKEDPTEPPTEGDYPYPALPHAPRIREVGEKLSKLGLKPFSLPMCVKYKSGGNPCILCDTCDGYPCLLDAKGDAETCCVKPALAYPNVTLITNAKCSRLLTNPEGVSITHVEVIRNGQPETFCSDIVVVSCGAINTAALLLRSANDKHPQGLANSSGLVGRNLMKHNLTKLYAISPTPNPSEFQKTLAINDYYLDSPEDDYPLGHIHLMGKHKWQMMRPDFPKFIPKSLLKFMSDHSVDWWLQSEDLPSENNRVTLDTQGKIKVAYRPNNLKAHRLLIKRFKAVLHQAGFPLTLEVPMPLQVVNHQVGTCRFGSDPQTSVLDPNCRTHDIENLYVVDASFFPSSSATNPTLTIVANALRVATHLTT